jgi:hypothetical protein
MSQRFSFGIKKKTSSKLPTTNNALPPTTTSPINNTSTNNNTTTTNNRKSNTTTTTTINNTNRANNTTTTQQQKPPVETKRTSLLGRLSFRSNKSSSSSKATNKNHTSSPTATPTTTTTAAAAVVTTRTTTNSNKYEQPRKSPLGVSEFPNNANNRNSSSSKLHTNNNGGSGSGLLMINNSSEKPLTKDSLREFDTPSSTPDSRGNNNVIARGSSLVLNSFSKWFGTNDRPNSVSRESQGDGGSREGSIIGPASSRHGSLLSVNEFYTGGLDYDDDGTSFEYRKNRESNLSASFEAVQPRRSDIKLPSIDIAQPPPSFSHSTAHAEKKLNIQSTYKISESASKHKYIPKVILDLQVRIDERVGDDDDDEYRIHQGNLGGGGNNNNYDDYDDDAPPPPPPSPPPSTITTTTNTNIKGKNNTR